MAAFRNDFMICPLDGPVNALSTNRDADRVVIVGRNILKIYSFQDAAFKEECNLKVGKLPTLHFSNLDVAWSHVQDDLLASAATNGSVVLWNLQILSRNKAESTYNVHSRTVNKVCFHPSEAHYLLSGSQDARAILFDLRKKEVALTFENGTDSVRDIKFATLNPFIFATVDETGNVKCWDIRAPEKPVKQFTAHNGPIFSIDFHPTARGTIATAGRDKIIKIWDWQTQKPLMNYSVQTIAPVSVVKWRPRVEWQIASCSLVMDFVVHVWDIRRPYIPYASFEEHKDVATGIAWRNEHVFFSCGKDGVLVHHNFDDAIHPSEYASPVGLDTSPYGHIAWAVSNHLYQSSTVRNSEGNVARFTAMSSMRMRRAASIVDYSELFPAPHLSTLSIYVKNANDQAPVRDYTVVCALKYRVNGRPLAELCDHNASVAFDLERFQVGYTWLILKYLYDTNVDYEQDDRKLMPDSGADNALVGDADFRSIESGDIEDMEKLPKDIHKVAKSDRYSAKLAPDLFDEAEFGRINFSEFGNRPNETGDREWKLQYEAFEPKTDQIRYNTVLFSESETTAANVQTSPSSTNEANDAQESILCSLEARPFLTVREDALTTRSWDFSGVVHDMLCFYAEKGDVQMSVSVLLVLSKCASGIVDFDLQKIWYQSYIDLLSRYELWSAAALVTKLCPIESINSVNQQSTAVILSCGSCKKLQPSKGCRCDKCKCVTSICNVCQEPTRGIFVWCSGCWHGGHLKHLQRWFKSNDVCPSGCGHRCEYN